MLIKYKFSLNWIVNQSIKKLIRNRKKFFNIKSFEHILIHFFWIYFLMNLQLLENHLNIINLLFYCLFINIWTFEIKITYFLLNPELMRRSILKNWSKCIIYSIHFYNILIFFLRIRFILKFRKFYRLRNYLLT